MISRAMKETYYRAMGVPMRVNGWIWRRFRAPTEGVIKVHLGPGQRNYIPGWHNVDANLFTAKIDVWADLRNPLPFRDGTVDAFYSHHVIEHLPDSLLSRHFAEMFRCLKPGGAIRVGGPDSGNAALKFAQGDADWFVDFPDKHDSIGGKFTNFIICRGEHLTVLTESYLREIAQGAGFVDVRRCAPITETSHGDLFSEAMRTEYEPTPEFPHTILVEADKPR
jgi:predicted SAM-dependent methyltransferase